MNKNFYVEKQKAEINFLKLESEYTRNKFEEALKEFNNYFKKSLENKNKKDSVKKKKVRDKSISAIYRKIANKVHPDKILGDENTFNRLTKMVENNDLNGLLEMAETYNVEIKNEINLKTYESTILNLKENIKELKSTIAYQWKYSNNDTKSKIESMLKN